MLQEQINQCGEYIEDNLGEICGEMLVWQDTALLKSDGKVRRAIHMLTETGSFDYHTAQGMVVSMIHENAMAFTIVHWPKQSQTT